MNAQKVPTVSASAFVGTLRLAAPAIAVPRRHLEALANMVAEEPTDNTLLADLVDAADLTVSVDGAGVHNNTNVTANITVRTDDNV